MTSKYDNTRFLKANTIAHGDQKKAVINLDHVLYITESDRIPDKPRGGHVQSYIVVMGNNHAAIRVTFHEDSLPFIKAFLV